MFRTDNDIKIDSVQKEIRSAEKNYVVQRNDYLGLHVYSNGGERIIDPDYELSKGQTMPRMQVEPPRYLVRSDGYVRFPMIGNVNVLGFTLYQVDSLLSIEYSKFYQGAFAVTKLLNKRVVVLGPIGGKIIPLENENMKLIEAIALYGGISDNGKAYNIRLIRGDLKNPDVSIIDLSTIDGMKKANLNIYANDIIYIETQRRFISESLREITPLISLLTSILTVVLILSRSN